MGGGGAWTDNEATRRTTRQHTRHHWRGGHRRARRAWLRCPWAVAGPGRASRQRAERSSRRGRLAGGPPPTGTQSSPARQHTTRHPEHPWDHKHPGPPAHTAAGHNGARPLVGTQNRPTPQGPGGSDNQREGLNAGSRRCRDHRDHFPDGRSKCRAWMRCPWRCLPCVGLRRKRWKSGWSIRQRSRRWFRRSRPGSGSEPAVRRTPGCQCH